MHAIIIWIIVIMVIFTIALGYSVMSRIMTSGVYEDLESFEDVNASADAQDIFSTTKGVFQYWPYFLVLAFLLWGLYAAGS